MPQITIDQHQKYRFKDVVAFVKREPSSQGKRTTQSDAFEILLQLFESAMDSGMTPGE